MSQENTPAPGDSRNDVDADSDPNAYGGKSSNLPRDWFGALYDEWAATFRTAYNDIMIDRDAQTDRTFRESPEVEVAKKRRRTILRVILAVLTGIILCGLVTDGTYGNRLEYDFDENDLGKIAKNAIKADRDYEIPDTSSTQAMRDAAWKAIPPLYEEEVSAQKKAQERISQAFVLMRDAEASVDQELKRLGDERTAALEKIAHLQAQVDRNRKAQEIEALAKEKANRSEKEKSDSEGVESKDDTSAATGENDTSASQKKPDADGNLTPEEKALAQLKDLPPLPDRDALLAKAFEDQKENWRLKLEARISDEKFNALMNDRFSEATQAIIEELVRRAYIHGVVESRYMLLSALSQTKRLRLRRIDGQTSLDESDLRDVSDIVELREVPQKIRQWMTGDLKSQVNGMPVALRNAIQDVAERQVRINLTFNQQETDNRRNIASNLVKPVIIQLKKGEKIIGDGEKIENRHLLILQSIRKQASTIGNVMTKIGLALMAILFIVISNLLAQRCLRRYVHSFRDDMVMAVILILFMALANLTVFVGDSMQDKFTLFTPDDLNFAIPAVAAVMLVRVLMTTEAAILFTIILSAMMGFVAGSSLHLALYTFLGALTAIVRLHKRADRTAVTKAGLWIAGVNLASITAFSLIDTQIPLSEFFATAGFAVINGALLCPALVTMFTPLCERFGYTTDTCLTELNNLNHELMHRLLTEAPGTYNHSSQLTMLVEAGAEAIGANPLLAKVCALYHDVGKLSQPTIFAENQTGVNPLNDMTPYQASKSIQNHVTEGYELAKQYRLPAPVAYATRQHHGTRLTGYFYRKSLIDERKLAYDDLCTRCAAELKIQVDELPSEVLERIEEEADRRANAKVKKDDFMYPGPIPQIIEVALVMLADVVEATTRSQKPQNAEELQSIIDKSIDDIFQEGQLDACDLTLKDLSDIKGAFFNILKGSNHSRPVYPGEEKRFRSGSEGNTQTTLPDKKTSKTPQPPPNVTTTPIPLAKIMPSKPPSAVSSFIAQPPTIIPTPVPTMPLKAAILPPTPHKEPTPSSMAISAPVSSSVATPPEGPLAEGKDAIPESSSMDPHDEALKAPTSSKPTSEPPESNVPIKDQAI